VVLQQSTKLKFPALFYLISRYMQTIYVISARSNNNIALRWWATINYYGSRHKAGLLCSHSMGHANRQKILLNRQSWNWSM